MQWVSEKLIQLTGMRYPESNRLLIGANINLTDNVLDKILYLNLQFGQI